MDAIRARFGSAFEWLVAAAFLFATVAVGSLILRELRAVTVASPAPIADEGAPSMLPASIPAGAVSVPVVVLLDGKQIRVGDTANAVATLLGRAAETGIQHVDRGLLGERLTRFYEHAGTRFILVFEPSEPGGEPRVGGIYIQ